MPKKSRDSLTHHMYLLAQESFGGLGFGLVVLDVLV